MLNIIIDSRQDVGKLQRTCKVCGDTYEGWNFVACLSCEREKQYIVTHLWNG